MCTQTDVRSDDLMVEVLHIELHHIATKQLLQYKYWDMSAVFNLTLYKRAVLVHYSHLLMTRIVDFVRLMSPVHHFYLPHPP